MSDFVPPYPHQFQGSRAAQALLKLLGWRVVFEGFPTLQGVAVVYPHTSNWDAPLMFLVKWTVGVQVKFWGKDTLFEIPLLGRWLRWIGGIPVQRTSAQGMAKKMAHIMHEAKSKGEYFWLGLAPEGTRKYIPGWRSGFYHVAIAAQVPLLVVTLDYSRKEVRAVEFLQLSGDVQADMTRIAAICAHVKGLRPELMAPVVLLDATVDRKDTVVR